MFNYNYNEIDNDNRSCRSDITDPDKEEVKIHPKVTPRLSIKKTLFIKKACIPGYVYISDTKQTYQVASKNSLVQGFIEN